MAEVFEVSRPNYLQRLSLENCGVDDGELAAMLKGLAKQDHFRVFSYKYNEFGEESLEAMKVILRKQHPSNLR